MSRARRVLALLLLFVRNTLSALADDTRNEIDFLAKTTPTPSASQAALDGDSYSRPPCTPTGKKKKSELVELVDDCIDQLHKENNRHQKVWNQEKEAGRRTYSNKVVSVSSQSSPTLTGEEVYGGEEQERRLALPLVGVTSGNEKVGRWLDLNSQPPASQSSVSTPVAGKGRPEDVRAMGDISHISPLSPINLNSLSSQPRPVSKLKRKVQGVTPCLSSPPVDIYDSFDKLLLSSDRKKRTPKVRESPATTTAEDDEPPALLSADETKKVIKPHEDANSFEMMEVENATVLTQTSGNPQQSPAKTDLSTCKHDDNNTHTSNTNTQFEDIEDDILWSLPPLEIEPAKAAGTPRFETHTGNIEDNNEKKENGETNTGSKSGCKVHFTVLGRMAHSVRPPRAKIHFLQLGRLASPKTRNFALSSLKDIVTKKHLFTEDLKDPVVDDMTENEKIVKTTEEMSDHPVGSASTLQKHLRNFPPSDEKKVSDQPTPETPQVSKLRIDSSIPDGLNTWVINQTIPTLDGNETGFMENILGDNSHVFTQEAETEQEVQDRVARLQQEEKLRAEAKRVRSEDSDIEDSCSVIGSQRKVARIDLTSEEDSEGTTISCTQQLLSVRPRPRRSIRDQESSVTTDSDTGGKLSTQEVEKNYRNAHEKARKLRQELEGEQEVFQTEELKSVEHSQVEDSDSDSEDMFGATPEKNFPPAPSRAPELSPVPELPDIPDTSSWKFVLSNIPIEMKAQCGQFIQSLDCLGVSPKVDDSVTHLIISTEDNLQAPRTLKYLQAVASGVMIVSYDWVEACLEDRGKLGQAEEWEVTDYDLSEANGPWRSRMRREQNGRHLLAGYEVLVDGELEDLDKPVFNDLLTRVGARRVHSLTSFSFTREITRLIITNSAVTYGAQNALKRLRKERLAVVEKEWLLDTIAGYSIRPLINYISQTITEDLLVKAGYSHPLVGVENK